jgi:putative AdoMet-dependent methyltransferase
LFLFLDNKLRKGVKMLDSEGFDLWADEYDNTVNRNNKKYPFDGYYDGLSFIYESIKNKKGKKVLDVGFGTAVLTKKLYDAECIIYGIDFSSKMIEIAYEKMPNAKLLQYDFNNEFPTELSSEKFDYIISSYAIHHLTDERKVQFINLLYNHLASIGKIIILDIAFQTKGDFDKCYSENKEDWDKSELYIIWDNLKDLIKINCNYHQISSCAGIIEINK